MHVRSGANGGRRREVCIGECEHTRDRVECLQSGSTLVWIAGYLEGTLLIPYVNMNNWVVENESHSSALYLFLRGARALEEKRAVAVKIEKGDAARFVCKRFCFLQFH